MKYFKIEELTHSQTAKAHSIANVPTAEALKNLEQLVCKVLDPLRERWGVPIYVNSGYRCPALNRKVGGSSTSYHLRGMAADITSRCVFHNVALYTEIRIMHDKGSTSMWRMIQPHRATIRSSRSRSTRMIFSHAEPQRAQRFALLRSRIVPRQAPHRMAPHKRSACALRTLRLCVSPKSTHNS